MGNWCQEPLIWTLTMPFSAARSLGSLISAVAVGESLMSRGPPRDEVREERPVRVAASMEVAVKSGKLGLRKNTVFAWGKPVATGALAGG